MCTFSAFSFEAEPIDEYHFQHAHFLQQTMKKKKSLNKYSIFHLSGVLGSLDHATNTMGVLDLGGGSTQITFAPRFEETILQGMPLGLIKTFRFMKESFQLYTHRFDMLINFYDAVMYYEQIQCTIYNFIV